MTNPTDRSFAATICIWLGVSLPAIGAAGCRAPAQDQLESLSRPLALAAITPVATTTTTPTLPPLALAAPMVCDQAMVFTGPFDPCNDAGGGWKGHVLISSSRAAYCHFSWTGTGSPDFTPLHAVAGRIVQPDCPVVGLAGAAPSLDPSLWLGLATAFKRQIGAATWQPPARSAEITVAVVDSAAKGYANTVEDDTFGHGRLVGRTIAALACPTDSYLDRAPDSCPLSIQNFLAVPRLPDAIVPAGDIDLINGGYFGTRGELGDALATALTRWEGNRAPQDRLILNLSLGWDAAAATLSSDIADEAIATLLARASCQGALSIAAAGNQAGPRSSSGPFLPAYWETRAAPARSECQSLWPALKVDASAAQARPLVYAAAAVDDQDRPLLTARLGGAPRLVATGIGAITVDRRGPGHTQVLSGSSIAAAVVSGIAASVWEGNAALAGPAVMDVIYGSAVDLASAGISTPPTVLCLTPPCASQRRVSWCATLTKVVAQLGLTPPACMTIPAGAGADPSVSVAPPSAVSTAPCSTCAPGQIPAAETPWVWPQPSGAACPSCLYFGPSCTGIGAGVMGQIDPAFVGSISNMVTTLNARAAASSGPPVLVTSVAARVVHDNSSTDFGLGPSLTPAMFWLQQPTGASQATISFTIALSGVPGAPKLTTSPQDVPVVCP